jgi:methylated-DNA-[protein]-cysteine S-methyltransferase
MSKETEMNYATVDTPYGKLMLVGGEGGLARVAFESEGFDEVLASLGAPAQEANGELDDARRQLEEYFAGERQVFDIELDLRGINGFRRSALEVLSAIPYGETRTYRQVAEAAGNPDAVRAAGGACATNPWPVIVPCHRVLRSDGGLGGYLGGLDMKRGLLELEAQP